MLILCSTVSCSTMDRNDQAQMKRLDALALLLDQFLFYSRTVTFRTNADMLAARQSMERTIDQLTVRAVRRSEFDVEVDQCMRRPLSPLLIRTIRRGCCMSMFRILTTFDTCRISYITWESTLLRVHCFHSSDFDSCNGQSAKHGICRAIPSEQQGTQQQRT